MKTLLVTTVGGRVGYGILEATVPWRDRIRVVGVNSIAGAAANFRCDAVYLAPATADRAAWMERMREILRGERPDVVLAGRDGDLVPLAALKTEPEFAATHFLCPGPEAAAVITDKYRSYLFARSHGLPFAETAVDADGVDRLLAAHGFPVIVKPRIGSGAHGVRALASRREVDTWLGRGGMVFQDFVDPPASLDDGALDPALGVPLVFATRWRVYYSVTATVGPDRAVSYQGANLITFQGADTTHSVRADDAENERITMGFAQALAASDFVGPLNVQGRRDRGGRFVPFELNGRITGGVIPRGILGVEELKGTLDLLIGDRPPAQEAAAARHCAMLRTFRWDRVEGALVESLERDGVWRADRR